MSETRWDGGATRWDSGSTWWDYKETFGVHRGSNHASRPYALSGDRAPQTSASRIGTQHATRINKQTSSR